MRITQDAGMCKDDAESTIHYYIKIILFSSTLFPSKINLELETQRQCIHFEVELAEVIQGGSGGIPGAKDGTGVYV